MTRRMVLVVAAALYNSDGRILLAQRPEGKAMAGLWEFPGGKVEPGETPEQALVRELREELSIMVDEASLEPVTFASHGYQDFHLLMPLYATKSWDGDVVPREGQTFAWVKSSDLHNYPAPAADIPLFDVLAGRASNAECS